jgi:hypothetical protein
MIIEHTKLSKITIYWSKIIRISKKITCNQVSKLCVVFLQLKAGKEQEEKGRLETLDLDI